MDFLIENYKIFLEIFGYIGTALVIISMMMTSVLKLRIINMCGGSISLIYAILCNTWPVVVLNACIICINLFHTIRQIRRNDRYGHVIANKHDATVAYFLSHYEKDIRKFYPDYSLQSHENSETHVIFASGEMVGILIGTREADNYRIDIDYVIPRYRSVELGKFIFSVFKKHGISTLTAADTHEKHTKYLKKLGFLEEDGVLIFKL